MDIHIVVINVFSNIRVQFAADLICALIEYDNVCLHIVLFQKCSDGTCSDFESLVFGIAVYAGRNQRKRNRLAAILFGKF